YQNSVYYTHGFHPYPAKYTPQLVNKYFKLFCENGWTILDPFCGSGTAIVEGALNGMNAVGIDLNPIAYIVSKAKSNRYNEVDLRLAEDIIWQLQALNRSAPVSAVIPDFPNRSHWFQDNVCVELAVIKQKIDEMENVRVKYLLMCAFSKIIVQVSNQDSEVRYTAKSKNHPDGIVYDLFARTLSKYIGVLKSCEYSILSETEILNGDVRTELQGFPDDYFDFVITSPPYINTFDYYLYHKLRMFWLGYDHRPVRANEIGNHHRIDTKSFDAAKTEYVDSMTEAMHEISRVSKPLSRFVMVIGDGIVDGITIDMSRIISAIAQQAHYEVESVESVNLRDITRSFNRKFANALKREHTIILKNRK
ncbi:MAG: hypothetical protein LBE74_06430, partial [Treponema sp.]|nr:hypothetical protein [Treponema sp.]